MNNLNGKPHPVRMLSLLLTVLLISACEDEIDAVGHAPKAQLDKVKVQAHAVENNLQKQADDASKAAAAATE